MFILIKFMKKRLYTLLFGFLLSLVLFTGSALAQSQVDDSSLYGGAAVKGDTSSALGAALSQSTDDPRVIAANVIRILLGFLGLFALGLILYAGWVIMRSEGEAAEIENAKKILKSGVIGLVIILSAFAIVSFILSSLLGAILGDGSSGENALPGGGNFDDSGSFKVISTNPNDGDFNVFRNSNIGVLFNKPVSNGYTLQDLIGKFTLEKTKQYNGPTTETGSSTPFSVAGLPSVVALDVATTSNYSELLIRASSTCQYVDAQGATSTIKNCIDAWSEYQLTVSSTTLSMSGLPLNCTNKCVITFTTNASIDLGRPVITSISPQGGFCDNAINTACLVDGDCLSGGKCDLKTPNAAVGNLVTITGDYFGNTPGEVYFGSSSLPADLASAVNPQCTNAWSNRQIITVMPAGLSSSSAIRVVEASANQWEDISNDSYGPKNRNVLLNTIARPGLCKITPSSGVSSATTTYQGANLTASQAYFGSLFAKIKSATNPFGLANSGAGFVPNVETGTTTTFALQGKAFSNFLAFQKEEEKYSGPYISGFDPISGNKDQYVTISGGGFGYAEYAKLGNTHRVFFSTLSNIVSSSTLLSSATEASYIFPEICRGDLWRDKEITIKVPGGLTIGTDYYIYLAFPKGTSTAWLINSAQIANPNFSKTFKSTAAPLTPGLCSLRPPVGQENSVVSVYGEYFPAAAAGGKVVFSFNKDGSGSVFGLPKEGGADKATTSVPDGALSGPTRVFDGALKSNSKNFTIGTCKKDEECGSSTGFCCTSGDGTDGVCRYAANRQKACYNNILSSIYEWSFSTSLATSSLTCSGLTNANSCLLANICPNSPGICETGNNVKAQGSCDDNFCKTTYPACGANCTYDSAINKCTANINCDTGGNVAPFSGVQCNKVGLLSLYQVDKKGQSCDAGSFFDANNKCTLGTPLNPTTCSSCPTGLSCAINASGIGGKCVVNQPVCTGNTSCQAGKCIAGFTCACCCRVAEPEKDCCKGLTCTPNLCVNNLPTLGQCTGCRIDNANGTVNQAASDNSCKCKSENRYCNVSPKLYVNGEWIDNSTGTCEDAAPIGAPCQASAIDLASTSASLVFNSNVLSQTMSFWRFTSPVCPAGSARDFDVNGVAQQCVVIDNSPLKCTAAQTNSTSTTIAPGYIATCHEVEVGVYYWQIDGKVPCPSSSYLAGNSTITAGRCTLVNDMPKNCSLAGATTTDLLDHRLLTCSSVTSNYQPSIDYNSTTTSNSTSTIRAGIPGGEVYYWQAPAAGNGAAETEGYIDRNGSYTYAPLSPQVKIPTCVFNVPFMTHPSDSLVPGYPKQDFWCASPFVLASGATTSYWYLLKAPWLSCPDGTALFGADTGTKVARCMIGAKPGLILNGVSCDEAHVDKIATSSTNIIYTCTKHAYTYSTSTFTNLTTLGMNYCSDANLPQCDSSAGLTCDPRSCTCQKKVVEVVTSQVNAGDNCKSGASPACTVGVDSCDGVVTTLQCLIDSNPFTTKDCRCCCVPGTTKVVKDINKVDKTLTCQADKGNCSGATRGLFCGCSADIECNNGVSGCGADTCCRARPFATSTYPFNNANSICRNTVVKMTFNEVMDPASLSGNMILVGEYGLQACPQDTSYLTTIKPKIGWWSRLIAWLGYSLNISRDTAYAETFGNYCAVEGKVRTADGGRSIEFLPKTVLKDDTNYYAIILGDASTTDKYSYGVLSSQGIGIHDDDGTYGSVLPTGKTVDFAFASSSQKFNGRTHFGYNWKFRTKPLSEPGQGVCLLDHVKLQPDGFDGTDYLFKTLKPDSSDNNPALNFDTVPKRETSTTTDNDKVFAVHALASNGGEITSITGAYQWRWDWSVDNDEVVKIQNGNSGTTGVPQDLVYALDPLEFDDGLDFHATKKLVVAQNKKDAQTYLNAKATVIKDVFSGSEGRIKASKSLIHVFLCENPWPPVLSWSNWPWTDNGTCKGGVACDNNNFQLYYCRDAGKPGTADDLPALGSQTAPTLASSTNIMKEYYFLRSGGVSGASNLGLAGVSAADGKSVHLSWTSLGAGAAGYKIYYGLSSGAYLNSFEVASINDDLNVSNLTPGQTYYITMTAFDADKQESKPVPEIVVTIADTALPAVPANLHISSTTGSSVTISWNKNSDDTVAYKVYYGTMHAIYGKSANVGMLDSYTIKNLTLGTLYYISVAAVDAAGNESSNITNEIIGKPGTVSFYQNTPSRIDFEGIALGALPTSWINATQAQSSIGVTKVKSRSGQQSVVLHQEAGYDYPGTCTQAICGYTPGCSWLAGTSQCSFNSVSMQTIATGTGMDFYMDDIMVAEAQSII